MSMQEGGADNNFCGVSERKGVSGRKYQIFFADPQRLMSRLLTIIFGPQPQGLGASLLRLDSKKNVYRVDNLQ